MAKYLSTMDVIRKQFVRYGLFYAKIPVTDLCFALTIIICFLFLDFGYTKQKINKMQNFPYLTNISCKRFKICNV